MKKQVVIDYLFDYERAALLENNQLKEVFFEKNSSVNVGDIFCAKVEKVIKNKFAFLNIGSKKNAFLCLTDKKEQNLFKFEKGKSLLKFKQGDKILVQVQKEGSGLKACSVTSNLKFAGKYIVVLPFQNTITFSKKFENIEKKDELISLAKSALPKDYGIIFRTSSYTANFKEISKEILVICEKITNIFSYENLNAPEILYKEKTQIEKVITQVLKEGDEVILNSQSKYDEFVEKGIFSCIKLYEDTLPIFDAFNIESKIEKALSKKVWLKSGGFLIIEDFEAMYVIDVNTGKSIKKDYENMIFQTNKEALKESFNQIRLRNLAGIICIDLIDMKDESHKLQIIEMARSIAKEDRQPIKIYDINELGILYLTRKKELNSMHSICSFKCPVCSGEGKIRSDIYILKSIKNRLVSIFETGIYRKVIVSSNFKIIEKLKASSHIKDIENLFKCKIEFSIISKQRFDYFEFEKFKNL